MQFHHITHGYKSFFTRISLVVTGMIFLIGINMTLFWKLSWGIIIITVISGYVLWSFLRLLKFTSYTFTPQGIDIVVPGLWKTQTLHFPKKQIISLNPTTMSWWQPFGISINPLNHQIQATTSNSHLYCITLEDQHTIIISPRHLDPMVVKYFNS